MCNYREDTIWGEKILQKTTALDRVNVRRLCFYIDKSIRRIAHEERHSGRSVIQIFDATFPRVEQFVEDCWLRKAFVSYLIETVREETCCLIKIKFKPTIDSNEVVFDLKIANHNET